MDSAGAKADEKQGFPAGSDVVSYVQTQQPRMKIQAQPAEQLLLEPKAFLTLIQFVSSCRTQGAFTPSDTQNFQGRAPLPNHLPGLHGA
jgi:hypothetical protein